MRDDRNTPIDACLNGIVDAGDALIYDYRLMHRGMPNNDIDGSASTDGQNLRPILQLFYHLPSYTERRNYGERSVCEPAQ